MKIYNNNIGVPKAKIIIDGENIDDFSSGYNRYMQLSNVVRKDVALINFRSKKLDPMRLFLAKLLKKLIN